MAALGDRVAAEYELLDEVVGVLAAIEDCRNLALLEVAGVAALLQNFYAGIENLLKQALAEAGVRLPTGPSWHRDLLTAAEEAKIVSPRLAVTLRDFLGFRHFFAHGYGTRLKPGKMNQLVRKVPRTYARFQREMTSWVEAHGGS